MSIEPVVQIVGAGLAGSEAAWQVASRGVRVVLHEMRPVRPTAVHKTAGCAELVCSNSFRGDKLDNAVGLLKEEMRRLGSLIMQAAETARVPAGAALAVDRERFSAEVTTALAVASADHDRPRRGAGHPAAARRRRPGDHRHRAADVGRAVGGHLARMVGAEHLYFYDAISPIVLAESIDRSKVFRASRWDRSLRGRPAGSRPAPEPRTLTPEPARRRPCLRRGRRAGRLPELSVHARRVRPLLRRARRRGVGDRARLRQHEVLRGLPADRGDGASRPRHAALRADEAGGPRRSAHRPLGLRGRAAAAGHARRRSLQPGRLPDAAQMERAGARAAPDPGPRAGRVRALRDGPPQHLRERADGAARRRGRCGRGRICSSPDRCPASRATSSRRRRGCSPASTRRGSPSASRRSSPRARRRSARSRTTPRTPIRRTTIRPTSRSGSCRRSIGRRAPRRIASRRSRRARSRISTASCARPAPSASPTAAPSSSAALG